MQKLVLFDAMAMIYRAYYALNKNPRINSKGLNTSAVLGFTTTLYTIYRKLNPSHIGVAFDLQTPTVRHEAFREYKATRDAMPEDISASIPYIKELLKAFRIPVLSVEGYEADDIIGTLSKKAEQQGFEVYMVTPDKDYGQLISDKIFMYKPGRSGKPDEILGVKEVCERYDIKHPEQVKDILGLMGDTSDNIPGIPGIGEVRAKKLIQEFNTVEELLQRVQEISNEKIRHTIEEHKEQALFSKELVTIILDVPIEFNEKELKVEQPDWNACKKLFDELEFRTFAKKFFADFHKTEFLTEATPLTVEQKSSLIFETETNTLFQSFNGEMSDLKTTPHEYLVIRTEEKLQNMVRKVLAETAFSFHVSTEKQHGEGELQSIAISLVPHNAYIVEMPLDKEQIQRFLNILQPLWSRSDIEKITYDLKSAKKALDTHGLEIKGKVFDIQLAHYLLEAETRHKIDYLSERYLSYQMLPEDMVYGKFEQKEQTIFETEKESETDIYNAEYADVCGQLKPKFEQQLKDMRAWSLFCEIEMPLVDVLFNMEKEGVSINMEYLQELSTRLHEQCQTIEQQIYAYAGHHFNIASPKQLGVVLYEELKIADKVKKTTTKQYSTAEDVLLKLVDRHPIVQRILDYRSLSKLISTYVDAFPQLINKKTQRVHTNFNQTVTATGRLSSTNPNLQNIPIRTDLGREIRKAFIPRNDNHVLMAADYSQIELRIIASLSGDEHMMHAFREGIDIHLSTAAKIYGVPLEKVTADMRRRAKSVNFGIIYGISGFGLSEQLGISRKEANTLIDEYLNQYQGVKKYIEGVIELSHRTGYAETLLGRRRYLPNINSRNANLRNFDERNAVNMPIQGTSADMIKIAMNRIFLEMKKEQLVSKMILQVHDELVFDVCNKEIDRVTALVKKHMTEALPLKIPVVVDIKVGQNWLEAH